MSTAAIQTVGHKYAGHCPARQNVRPLTDTTKSRAGKPIVPLPGAIVDMLLAQRESQSVERQRAAQLWSEEGWVLEARLVVRSIPEPTGTPGSVYLQPLMSATDASTMPVTPQQQNSCCSAYTSARS
jgi:hypothetical protein